MLSVKAEAQLEYTRLYTLDEDRRPLIRVTEGGSTRFNIDQVRYF